MIVPHMKQHETHLRASTAYYGDIFFLYVGDIRTSQETRVSLQGLLQQ
jgi:hypothetical protein